MGGSKINVTLNQAIGLIVPYARKKIMEQVKSVAFLIAYLVLFQSVLLGIPITDTITVTVGLTLVVLGLSFFMEGLVLGLMPLGEVIGIRLPRKSPLPVIMFFAFALGVGATFAEPAIGVLRVAGSSVKPWEAPLLYVLLNKFADLLVYSVGAGVGIAVLLGTLRFLYNLSLKPFIFALGVTLIGLTSFAYFDPNLIHLTGLAWDSGAVTTGPVTVPLVLALGIGISRISGRGDSPTAGFGVVTLASLFPVVTVLILGIFIGRGTPAPTSYEDFFHRDNLNANMVIFASVEEYNNIKNKWKPAEARIPHWSGETKRGVAPGIFKIKEMSITAALAAIRAILPLSFFLLFFLLVILKEKLPRTDEVLLGIVFSLLGMGIFNIGIEIGLTGLGNQVGRSLPSAFTTVKLPEKAKTINNFDTDVLKNFITESGEIAKFFYFKNGKKLLTIIFNESDYNSESRTYHYTPGIGPRFGRERGLAGLLAVFVFAFFMGYGATMAEPALNALGLKVEEITIGTFKKNSLMKSVAVGVGMGIAIGVARIIWNIPLAYLIVPPYILLIPMTLLSSEEFVNIGWDSAGVTTGPITVPLVLAMGSGIGNEISVVEGFGILATASVWPILSVLGMGIYVNYKRNFYLRQAAK